MPQDSYTIDCVERPEQAPLTALPTRAGLCCPWRRS